MSDDPLLTFVCAATSAACSSWRRADGRNNHDELMAEAQALTAESPRIAIRRVRSDMLDEAHGLERAVASQLRRRGISSSQELDSIEFDNPEEEEVWYYSERSESAEELAEKIAKGAIEPTDERLQGVDRLAAKLRAATLEAERLGQLMLEADRRLQAIRLVRILLDSDDRVEELWQFVGGFVVVAYVRTGEGRRMSDHMGEFWIDHWKFRIYASDEAETRGTQLLEGSSDGRYDTDVTRKAIAALPVNRGV